MENLLPECAAPNCFTSTFDDRQNFSKLPNRSWPMLLLTSSVFWRDKEEWVRLETLPSHVQGHNTELTCLCAFSDLVQQLRRQTPYAHG